MTRTLLPGHRGKVIPVWRNTSNGFWRLLRVTKRQAPLEIPGPPRSHLVPVDTILAACSGQDFINTEQLMKHLGTIRKRGARWDLVMLI
jgi:hypothetical protein